MQPDRRSFLLAGGAAVAGLGTASAAADNTVAAQKFIDGHVKTMHPLDINAGIAWWNANITGKDDDFKKKEETQNKIDAALADQDAFAAVKKLKDDGNINDKLVARQIDLLYLAYLEKQVDSELLKKMTAKANAVEQSFNVYRAKVEGNEMSASDVAKVLKTSTDSDLRQKVWEASKGVGKAVEADLKELVGLRNAAAVKLGFKNYHAMSVVLNEQDGDSLIKLFDELDKLTREPYKAAKAEIDEKLSAKYSVKVADLMPWHYFDPFFPGITGGLRCGPGCAVPHGGHPETLPRVLCRHRPADRRRDCPQRPLRKER